MHNLIFSLIKASALAAIVYFSAAFAIQINLGGDVEYWLTLFIGAGVFIYGLAEWKQKLSK